MNEKREKEMSPRDRVAVIVCYRRPYSKEAMKTIKRTLEANGPDKALILRINETRRSSRGIVNYLGTDEMSDFRRELENDRKERIDGYSDSVEEMCGDLGIPVVRMLRSGKGGEIILDVIEKYDPCCVFIHHSYKGWLDKRLTGSVMEDVTYKERKGIVILK